MTTTPISPDLARRIWAILAEECGASATPTWICPAPESYGERFVAAMVDGCTGCANYTFDQKFGGVFHAEEWAITFDPRYLTPARVAMIARANARLAALRDEVERPA